MSEHAPTSSGRYGALRRQHSALEERIANELRRPIPDSLALQSLKRRRLRIKEQMTAFLSKQHLPGAFGITTRSVRRPVQAVR